MQYLRSEDGICKVVNTKTKGEDGLEKCTLSPYLRRIPTYLGCLPQGTTYMQLSLISRDGIACILSVLHKVRQPRWVDCLRSQV